jgi:hypothetical protein
MRSRHGKKFEREWRSGLADRSDADLPPSQTGLFRDGLMIAMLIACPIRLPRSGRCRRRPLEVEAFHIARR